MPVDINTLMVYLIVIIATFLGVEVALNYLIKSQMTTAVNSINATATTAINANLAVTQAGISSLLEMATLNDVNHLANEKVKAGVQTSSTVSSSTQAQAKTS